MRARSAIAGSEPPASTPLPNWRGQQPDELWPKFFQQHRPNILDIQAVVLQMHSAEEYEHVIWVIQSALINGQSQPWMYEVLALTMELADRPRAEIERVLLSLTDFGSANFDSMMYSAAYLARFDRREAALRLYAQAAEMAPERPEPYILALPHAKALKSAEHIQWAASGILRFGWTRDFRELHRDAENAALQAEQWLRDDGRAEEADALRIAIRQAQQRDLIIRLDWNGNGDLDLYVEEPAGSVCSFQNRDSAGGGVLTHDGYGPDPDNCHEEYICAMGSRGEYRIQVKHAWGTIVGQRARLTIVKHAGTDHEESETRTLVLESGQASLQLALPNGRRTQLKTIGTFQLDSRFDAARPLVRGPRLRIPGELEQAALEGFEDSRRNRVRRAGAVGYQPVISIIPEGNQLTAGAVVSADRRYVRIAAFPLFSDITDVFTFSFISGAGSAATQ